MRLVLYSSLALYTYFGSLSIPWSVQYLSIHRCVSRWRKKNRGGFLSGVFTVLGRPVAVQLRFIVTPPTAFQENSDRCFPRLGASQAVSLFFLSLSLSSSFFVLFRFRERIYSAAVPAGWITFELAVTAGKQVTSRTDRSYRIIGFGSIGTIDRFLMN